MSGFYRFEFVHGPHDGLTVEGNTLVAPRLTLPIQRQGVDDASAKTAAAEYALSTQALRWEEGAPQAVLRYEFLDPQAQVGSAGRFGRWFAERRQRLAHWMLAPVSYPMTTRSR